MLLWVYYFILRKPLLWHFTFSYFLPVFYTIAYTQPHLLRVCLTIRQPLAFIGCECISFYLHNFHF